LRHAVRRASPVVAQQSSDGVARLGGGAPCARRTPRRGEPRVASRRCEVAVTPRRVPGADDDHDGTADDDHDRATADDDHDGRACARHSAAADHDDDHEAAGYPRVVDLSPEGFAQIADPSQGVVEVTISW
jgi:hypothetical protein